MPQIPVASAPRVEDSGVTPEGIASAAYLNDVANTVTANASDAESRMSANTTAIKPTQNYLSTGLLSGGILTINGGDDTLFDISAGTGIRVDNSDPLVPIVIQVSWDAFIGESLPDISGDFFTSLSIADDGLSVIKIANESPTHAQELTAIYIGNAIHAGSSITSVAFKPVSILNVHHQFKDLADAIGAVNLNDGALVTSNGANLKLNKSEGMTFSLFGNMINNPLDPHHVEHDSESAFVMGGSYRDGAGGFTFTGVEVTDVSTSQYDDGSGSLVSFPGGTNNWTVHALWYFATSNNYVLEFGQSIYSSLAAAVGDIPPNGFLHNPTLREGGSLRAWIAVKKSSTDLSDTLTNAIIAASRINP